MLPPVLTLLWNGCTAIGSGTSPVEYSHSGIGQFTAIVTILNSFAPKPQIVKLKQYVDCLHWFVGLNTRLKYHEEILLVVALCIY